MWQLSLITQKLQIARQIVKGTLTTNCKIAILSYETNGAIYHIILKYGFIH